MLFEPYQLIFIMSKLGYDSKCQEACSQRMNSYDWVECLDKMKEDCHPTVVKALPFFADRLNMIA